MEPVAVMIADAVVADLNGTEARLRFGRPFTAERMLLPRFDRKDMKTLHVTVYPGAISTTVDTRQLYEDTYRIDIGVQQEVDRRRLEVEVAEMLALVEAIMRRARAMEFRVDTGDGDQPAHCMEVQGIDPPYYPEHLDRYSVFTTVLMLTFRTWSE